jgi:hypothetical protein
MGLIYEVFDLANDEVSLAEQAWNDDLDDIVEITKDGVPEAKNTGTKKNVGNRRCVARGLGVTALVAAIMLATIT